MGKKKSKKTKAAAAPGGAQKYSAESPEARDEGPRLLPLHDENPLIPKEVKDANARYIALADQMLGKKKPTA